MRYGADAYLPRDRETGAQMHTMQNVYAEMLLQICRDYSALPDVRTLRNREIRFFYAPLRPELREHTKPRTKTKSK